MNLSKRNLNIHVSKYHVQVSFKLAFKHPEQTKQAGAEYSQAQSQLK